MSDFIKQTAKDYDIDYETADKVYIDAEGDLLMFYKLLERLSND